MKVYFSQVYIEVGVKFPFSHLFQRYLSTEISALVQSSAKYVNTFGGDFALTFNMSAKKAIENNEIRGPVVFKKTNDVEYSIFLPFDVISQSSEVAKTALYYLFRGVCSVFESLDIDTSNIVKQEASITQHICSDPSMFK